MPLVKCRDCGYLSVYDENSTESCEADDRVREFGMLVSRFDGRGHPARVFCYQNVREFTSEETHGQSDVKDAINKEIECSEFKKRERGKTAEKIKEITILDQVKQENQEAREQDIARNQRWREEEMARTEAWKKQEDEETERRHQELQVDAERRHKQTLEWQAALDKKVELRHGRSIAFNFLNVIVSTALTLGAVLFLQWVKRLTAR